MNPTTTQDPSVEYQPAPKKQPKAILYLDTGHAGDNTNIKDSNPLKRYETKGKSVNWLKDLGRLPNDGLQRQLHGQGIFCEGFENRRDAKMLLELLAPVIQSGELQVVLTAHEYKDTPLKTRTATANQHWRKAGQPKALFLSLHYNAASGDANGIIAFTSPGKTKSDQAAQIVIAELLKNGIPAWQKGKDNPSPCVRTQAQEEAFAVLVNTAMPSLLMESGFMTTEEEVLALMYDTERYKKPMLKAYAEAIKLFLLD